MAALGQRERGSWQDPRRTPARRTAMNLVDAGPLIAWNDQADPYHHLCLEMVKGFSPQRFSTTWPCIAEAMYLLGQSGGYPHQRALWRTIRGGAVDVVDIISDEVLLAEFFMDKYQDLPMDLADATLVALAELRGWPKIFTLDSHFYAYRLRD